MYHADNTRRPGPSGLARWAMAAVLACIAVAGCAPGAAPPPAAPPATTPATAAPPPATYSATLCAAAAQFQSAANAIVELDATKVGTEGVKAALQNLGSAGRNLASEAKEQFGPQVDNLNQAIETLQVTTAGLSDQNSLSAKLGALTASVSGVEQAAKPIMDSIRTGCPSVPPVVTPTG
ncbi:hypothetical protein ACQPZQ_03820 [Pseudonocardia sp. CA-142604]|uniref:hypothetical protein n=1 Tax=Pseudonocardia sp. CA-142604 TaxID=3240024 RepID=UPI003D8E4AD4